MGLTPKEVLTEAGKYYLKRQGKSLGVPEKELLHIAVKSMNLEDVAPFDLKKKVIEYAYASDEGRLVAMTLKEFTDELSTDSPAPGGGSVAALVGARRPQVWRRWWPISRTGKKNIRKSGMR